MTPTRWMARFAAARIELIAPHKLNRTRPRTQDGRPLSRYQRRYRGFVHLACVLILLRAYL
jgi:hypothetical protein